MSTTRGARPELDGTHRVHIGRMRAIDESTEYLAILIRKPLADSEIELLETVLGMLVPDHGWIYTPRGDSHAA